MIRILTIVLALALLATTALADRYKDCAQRKDPDLSIRACTEIIEGGARESDEQRALAYKNRGIAHYVNRDCDRAIIDLDRAIAINPNHAEAYEGRGICYAEKREYDRALLDFDRAIELNPKLGHAYYGRGIIYFAKGETAKANAEFAKAVELMRQR